jgi:ribose transport system ATP-binding protein
VTETALVMEGIDKRFPGVHALKGVDLRVGRGQVMGIVGENGAGRSRPVVRPTPWRPASP